ncbi:PAS domain S-box protein [Leptolyngbya sp. CCNP1308]|uniref:hybrid sensor histidine kinase/response regulator n=1 Tax=Leptolyngbya sp. CCNP1308 TaxID=3110255 RepID=UPI002B1EBDC2|nr:PAS domain S-box protein [Leptolyngbya sp. CCNP1308]MEA5452665.1 PAS domain S-box protein [Leptolyngbya sp. CCNP1308]
MASSSGLAFLRNGGETGSLIRAFNWSDTPLGPMETWPHSLTIALQILLSSRFPMQILWGPDYIQFYNDAYIPIAGNKHPAGIGQRGEDCWQEVWDFSGALLDQVRTTGEATWSEDQPMILNRNGRAEEGYFTFSYTPIWDKSGQVGGIFIAVNETTQKILGERRERALRAEAQAVSENLENVLTSISDEFMMLDSNWCFTYVNDRAVTALQKPRQDLLGQSIWAVFPEAIATPFYEQLHRAVEAQTVTSFELFSAVEGRWLENRVYPFENGVSLLRSDISDRKNLEQALQTSQEQLNSLLNTAPASIARCRFFADRTYILDYRSVGCEALTGYSLAELTPKIWTARTFTEDWAANADRMFDAVFEQRPITVEYRFRHQDGSIRWIADSLTSRRDEAQDCWTVTLVGIDITARRQAEDALRESEERYRVLAEAMPQMVWMADRTGVQYWNQRWYEYTGISKNAAAGIGGTKIVHPDEQVRTLELWQQAIEQGTGFEIEQRIRRHDGVYRWFINRGLPVQDSRGEVTRWVGTITDVDDQKQLETQRFRLLEQERVAREAAETANRIKDEFLAVLSHELRSPLNPILGWARLLRTGQLNEAKVEYALETIERNAKLQAQLIDDLLDVSRILRGKLVLNSLPISLTMIIQEALETVSAIGEAKGVQLDTELDRSPSKVLGDPNRLKQVVWNLLSNAVKFTPQGGHVTVRLDYGDSWAQIQVSDTGKGIAPEFLPHVFDRFRQADSTTTRDFGGLGLGLAIAHQIVDLHHGTIQAASPGENQGATFTVRFPVMVDAVDMPAETGPPVVMGNLQNIHVLIVEDDADSRDLITTTLQQLGAQVTALPSAAAAITALSQMKPDILISDIGMPGMDGYMLMQQIRAVTRTQQIPAIALTSYTSEIDQQKVLAAGFQKHLPKPMESAQLVEAIATLVQRGSA